MEIQLSVGGAVATLPDANSYPGKVFAVWDRKFMSVKFGKDSSYIWEELPNEE